MTDDTRNYPSITTIVASEIVGPDRVGAYLLKRYLTKTTRGSNIFGAKKTEG